MTVRLQVAHAAVAHSQNPNEDPLGLRGRHVARDGKMAANRALASDKKGRPEWINSEFSRPIHPIFIDTQSFHVFLRLSLFIFYFRTKSNYHYGIKKKCSYHAASEMKLQV